MAHMQSWTSYDFEHMEQRFRAHFFQSISGYRSVVLLGTRSVSGQENLCIISSLVHVGSNPPYLGLIFRPETVDRHSLKYLRETQSYTLNHIHSEIMHQAHQTSAKYASEVSEFEAVGLTPYYIADFKAPFVAEAHIQFGLHPIEEHALINGCTMVIGKVTHVQVAAHVHVLDDGFVDLTTADSLTGTGQDAYFKPHFVKRLPYARP